MMSNDDNEFARGWQFTANIAGADAAAKMGALYVDKVNKAIIELEKNINNHPYRNIDIDKLQGYMLEEYAAGTFNVNAAAAGSRDRAVVLHSLEKNSVDISLNSGKDYSAKSYATPEKTAKEQARFNPDTGRGSYDGMGKLVPSDYLTGAKEAAHKEALKNSESRPENSGAYAEAEVTLTDTITNKEGVSSNSAKRKDLEKMARESKNQDFNADDYGVSLESAINARYILKQAIKSGITTAAINIAFQVTPEIYKAIDYLIKNGEIDAQQICRIGAKALSAGAEGFILGSVSSCLYIMCGKGLLGAAFKDISPTLLGTVVAVVMQTVKNSILVASGKMTAHEMGTAFVDTAFISGGYLAGAYIGGAIVQAINPELPALGYLIGSLIGTAFCAVYNVGKKKLISLCIDTGFTCFGLVEQNYQLPEELLRDMGIDLTPILKTEVSRTNIDKTTLNQELQQTKYETVDIKVLRRGIIGVNKIGYIL